MTTTLTIDIPREWWHTSNDRGGWQKFHGKKKRIRRDAYLAGRAHPAGPFEVAHVTAYIGYPRAGRADPGNASPVVKAVLDGLTDAGYWADDDSERVIGPDYRRDPDTKRPGVHTLRLVIEEVSP